MSTLAMMKGLMVISHPGHEVAAYYFMHQYRLPIYCLTDGSSGTGIPRHQDCHHQLLQLVGGNCCGYLNLDSVLPESLVYRSMLEQHYEFIQSHIVQSLQQVLDRVMPDIVLIDAYEGYNPIHDLLHLCAVYAIAQFKHQHPATSCLAIKLTSQDYNCPRKFVPDSTEKAILATKELSSQKLAYATFLSRHVQEIPRSAVILSELAGQPERCHPIETDIGLDSFLFSEPPFYEQYGRSKVAAGKFQQAIEFNRHILPLIEYLLSCE